MCSFYSVMRFFQLVMRSLNSVMWSFYLVMRFFHLVMCSFHSIICFFHSVMRSFYLIMCSFYPIMCSFHLVMNSSHSVMNFFHFITWCYIRPYRRSIDFYWVFISIEFHSFLFLFLALSTMWFLVIRRIFVANNYFKFNTVRKLSIPIYII